MTRPIKNPKRTPAEAARERLGTQPSQKPQPIATAVVAPPVSTQVSKGVLEELNEKVAAAEARAAATLKRLTTLEGHIAELAHGLLLVSVNERIHAFPKTAEAFRRIATHHQDKIKP